MPRRRGPSGITRGPSGVAPRTYPIMPRYAPPMPSGPTMPTGSRPLTPPPLTTSPLPTPSPTPSPTSPPPRPTVPLTGQTTPQTRAPTWQPAPDVTSVGDVPQTTQAMINARMEIAKSYEDVASEILRRVVGLPSNGKQLPPPQNPQIGYTTKDALNYKKIAKTILEEGLGKGGGLPGYYEGGVVTHPRDYLAAALDHSRPIESATGRVVGHDEDCDCKKCKMKEMYEGGVIPEKAMINQREAKIKNKKDKRDPLSLQPPPPMKTGGIVRHK